MILLKSDRLEVGIREPMEKPNDGFRFDRAGYISDVVLDGERYFCASEPRNLIHPSSGGRGLCSEYRFDVSTEAEVGEYFPKFGIGLIRKEDSEKYCFYRRYRELRPFVCHYECKNDSVTFLTEPMICLGYGMRTKKKISVMGNQICMEIEAENCGEKIIHMQEFCHNFISIDGMAVGSDYELEIPLAPDLGDARIPNRRGFSGNFRGNGKGVTFCEFTPIDTDLSIDTEKLEKALPFQWKMTHKGAGAYVQEEDSFLPGQINIWGVDHILSPEIVHVFDLELGETEKWTRTWTFDTCD